MQTYLSDTQILSAFLGNDLLLWSGALVTEQLYTKDDKG